MVGALGPLARDERADRLAQTARRAGAFPPRRVQVAPMQRAAGGRRSRVGGGVPTLLQPRRASAFATSAP